MNEKLVKSLKNAAIFTLGIMGMLGVILFMVYLLTLGMPFAAFLVFGVLLFSSLFAAEYYS